jgi:hypothetical protein
MPDPHSFVFFDFQPSQHCCLEIVHKMLCDYCLKISFKPLKETRYGFRADLDEATKAKYSEELFYFHHCCLPCVRESWENGCQLCALILTRLLGPEYSYINGSKNDGLCAALALPGAYGSFSLNTADYTMPW